jgi:uncharacterized membrane protein
MTALLRRVAALGVVAAVVIAKAVMWERVLVARRGGRPADPLRMLVVVDAPIERTWRVLADIPLQPAWMHEMKEVRITTPGPTGVGTRGEATVRIFGIAVTDPVEVTVFEPPVRFAIRHEGLFTGGGLITLEPGADDSTTIVRWEETLVPPILPVLGAALMAPVLREIFQADLHRLKGLVETGSLD